MGMRGREIAMRRASIGGRAAACGEAFLLSQDERW
jgi:hypothetical protein